MTDLIFRYYTNWSHMLKELKVLWHARKLCFLGIVNQVIIS